MGFDDFDVEFRLEDFCRIAGESKKRVHADAEVRRENDRDRFRSFFNHAVLLCRMTRGANDQWPSMLQGRSANPFDDIGVTEIDCDIAILHCRSDWIPQITLRHDRDAWV